MVIIKNRIKVVIGFIVQPVVNTDTLNYYGICGYIIACLG